MSERLWYERLWCERLRCDLFIMMYCIIWMKFIAVKELSQEKSVMA